MRRRMVVWLGLFLVSIPAAAAGEGPGEAPAEVRDGAALADRSVEIQMTELESGRWLRGTVSGLAAGEEEKLKVLVYVLTDKWYVHPEAVATPGLGFAEIDATGRWEIRSVWRGHQATRLALLVVARAAWAPPTLEPGEIRPEDSLRSRLAPLALSVLEAPAGI